MFKETEFGRCCGTKRVFLWLKADLQPPEFDFRFPPNTGHSEAHAGLPLVTQSGRRPAAELPHQMSDERWFRVTPCTNDGAAPRHRPTSLSEYRPFAIRSTTG